MSGGSQLDAVQDTEAFAATDDNFVMIVFRGSHERTVCIMPDRCTCSCSS